MGATPASGGKTLANAAWLSRLGCCAALGAVRSTPHGCVKGTEGNGPLPRAAMVMIACPLPRMTRHWDVPLPEELPAPQEWKDAGEYPEEIPFDLQELKDTCKERNIPYDERRDEEMSLRERILQDMIRRYAQIDGVRYTKKDKKDKPK